MPQPIDPTALDYRDTLPLDDELLAMAVLAACLARLDRDTALRVLRWATDRCLKPPTQPR